MDVRCQLPALRRPGTCDWLAFRVLRDGIEIKCPRCRRVHLVNWDRIVPAFQPST